MSEPERNLIVPIPAFRCVEAGSFVAQMDDLSRRLAEDTRGLTPAMLSWQCAPGMNTIGMLLAHNAIVEVFWTSWVLEHRDEPHPFHDVLGIGGDDDGMPLRPRGVAPSALAGKSMTFFDDLLERARARLRLVAGSLTDAALDEELPPKRSKTGPVRIFNRRWAFYHMLEHYAGHYGQILLLIHQYRAAHPEAPDAARTEAV